MGAESCPADAESWRGLRVCDEQPRDGYDRDAFESGYTSLEDDIIAALPPAGRSIRVLVHRVRDHRRRDRRDGHRAHRCSGRGARQWNRRRSATRHRKRPRQPHNRGSDGEPVGEERPGRGRVDAGPTRRLVRATRHRRQAGIRVERRPGRTGRACRSARGRRRGAQLLERRHHSPDGRNQYERERPR